MNLVDSFEKIRTTFFWRRCITLPDGRNVAVAILLREDDWRALDAPWWRGKQASIIGADVDGNFFLRHCDGSVLYRDHNAGTVAPVAPGIREFAKLIVEGGDSVA
ncbi:hypothetical protein [Massilia antarctica]|uniref:hypothetical protein n=1 Tax=Massilia antarctica TaxID=2765360 RepID=UPI0006BB739F|nr:hypothetical protein [Massilia sp. H27-R4]MCY0913732.1 hypothetical protein [Massilia sp. H27-R4]